MAKNVDPMKVLALNCSVCPYITQKLERLFSHIELFHPKHINVDVYKCEACGAISTSTEFLDEHVEIHHSSGNAKTASSNVAIVKLFSQIVNDNKKGDDQRRPLLGKGYDATGSGDGKKDKWVCEVCRVILDSEELMNAHTADKHPGNSNSGPLWKQNGNGCVIPLACIDIRQTILAAPIYIKDQGSYIVDVNRDGVYARIKYYPKFFNKADSDRYLKDLGSNSSIGWQQRTAPNHKTGKDRQEPRLSCYIGPQYEYAGVKWEENLNWPDELREIKEAVESATGHTFNSVLGVCYRTGQDSIGWHSDDEPELGKYPTIASISFGVTRAFELSKAGYQPPYMCVYLGHGDLMVSGGSLQERWKHRVGKAHQVREQRVNFTFRTVNPSLRKPRGPKSAPAKQVLDKTATETGKEAIKSET